MSFSSWLQGGCQSARQHRGVTAVSCRRRESMSLPDVSSERKCFLGPSQRLSPPVSLAGFRPKCLVKPVLAKGLVKLGHSAARAGVEGVGGEEADKTQALLKGRRRPAPLPQGLPSLPVMALPLWYHLRSLKGCWFHIVAHSPPTTFHHVPLSQILLPLERVVSTCVFPEALRSAVALLPPPGPGNSPAQHTGAAAVGEGVSERVNHCAAVFSKGR